MYFFCKIGKKTLILHRDPDNFVKNDKSPGEIRLLTKNTSFMARSIEFLAPVEAMRGNLSGDQTLTYPTQDNAAFDAPNSGRVYANNYNTRYIGAKRSSDGKKFFMVKQRSAYNSTAATKLKNALLGGTGAIVGALFKMSNFETVIRPGYQYAKANSLIPNSWTLRKYVSDAVYNALRLKENVIRLYTNAGSNIFFRNPWVWTGSTGAVVVEISSFVLRKFWMYLAQDPIEFDIEGSIGVAHSGDTFASVISSAYNVLGLTSIEHSSTNYVQMNELWLQVADGTAAEPTWSYVETSAVVKAMGSDDIYRLYDDEP